LVNNVKNSNNLKKNKAEMVLYLKNLEAESKNLMNFKNKNYTNKTEVKNFLIQILKNIKNNIIALKRVL
jgi:hypothetical protein